MGKKRLTYKEQAEQIRKISYDDLLKKVITLTNSLNRTSNNFSKKGTTYRGKSAKEVYQEEVKKLVSPFEVADERSLVLKSGNLTKSKKVLKELTHRQLIQYALQLNRFNHDDMFKNVTTYNKKIQAMRNEEKEKFIRTIQDKGWSEEEKKKIIENKDKYFDKFIQLKAEKIQHHMFGASSEQVLLQAYSELFGETEEMEIDDEIAEILRDREKMLERQRSFNRGRSINRDDDIMW